MKIRKKVAGLAAMALAATPVAVGVAVGTATSAQAASATIAYTCGLANGIGLPGPTISPYTGIKLNISVSPAAAPEGTAQTITLNLGGNGTTADGPSPFVNGPLVGSSDTTYRVVFNISINGSDDLINVVSSTPSAVADPEEPAFTKGVTASISTASLSPALGVGVHTVALKQIVVDSVSSGPAWVTGATTNVAANALNFDSICNAGTTQMTIVGNTAPTAGYGSPTAQPDSYMNAAETNFEVEECGPTSPTGTATALSASPASPQLQGTNVKLDATVTASSCNLGSKTIAGKVQFKANGTAIGEQSVAAGKASLTTNKLPVGVNAVTAAFVPTDDSGADGFSPSTSDALSYRINAKDAPDPTPTEDNPGGSGPSPKPRSEKKTIAKVYCSTYSKASQPGYPATQEYKNWPVTITVSPGAAKPGDTVKVSVSLNATINNGPVTVLDPKQYRFEPSITFQGKDYLLTNGPQNPTSVPTGQPIFKDLPLTASTTIDLPNKEGDFPIKLRYLNFNNVVGSVATPGLTDVFDYWCNASNNPIDAPKAFGAPSVEVTASNDAEGSEIDPGDESGNAGGSGGVLPATGPKEIAILAILALAVLQIGAIVTVRAQRAVPRKIRD